MPETCPVCRSAAGRTHECASYQWLECSACGLLWEAGWPADRKRSYASYYKDGPAANPTEFNPANDKIERCLHGDIQQWKDGYDFIERLVAPYLTKHDTCLEVGFGGSEMLGYARELGTWKRLVGTEVCDDYLAFARSRGHEVYYADVADAEARDKLRADYDFVYSVEVMEHVQDPVAFALGIKDLMGPTTPWLSKFARPRPVLDHGEWYYWSRKAVDGLFTAVGMQLLTVYEEPYTFYTVAKK